MSQDLNRGIETGVTRAEETLRLVARMPAPNGLGLRVKARLKNAQQGGRVLAWPGTDRKWSHSALVRGAAAAMIVCVVSGGAWGVYSHVQNGTSAARVMQAPIRQAAPGGFSNAGAVRSPQGQVLVHPVKPKDGKKDAADPTGEKKSTDAAKMKSGSRDTEAVGTKLKPMNSPAHQ